MKQLHSIFFLRRLLLPILHKVNFGDISIRHHWTGEKLKIHSFTHKGYWYHGKNREIDSMNLFSELIKKGDSVIEVGGHIGYISLYFAKLVGPKGAVTVFEPGKNNLPYIRKNTESNDCISVIDKAVSDYTGIAKFYLDELSGQNNSLLDGYSDFKENKKFSGINFGERKVDEILCTRLDDFLLKSQHIAPSFVKIDVEGSELKVLNGMKNILKNDVVLMVEVTENSEDIFRLLTSAGFRMFSQNKRPINSSDNMRGNIFCLKESNSRIKAFPSQGCPC